MVVIHLMTIVVVVVVVDRLTALLVAVDTATEALRHAVMKMTMTVVDMAVLRLELVPRLMTTLLLVVAASKILIVATTQSLTRMLTAMVDLLHETTRLEITLPEMLVMLTMIVVVVTGKQLSKLLDLELTILPDGVNPRNTFLHTESGSIVAG